MNEKGVEKKMENIELKNKARGMLIGLAIGDALGAPYEFGYKSEDIIKLGDKISHFKAQTKDFKLPKGAWTDDTSMALCIADSILERGGYDSYDIMNKFVKWFLYGYRSSVDHSVGIGQQTSLCLLSYGRNKTIPIGAKKTTRAGNGPIMRLAPIVIAGTIPNSLDDIKRISKMARLSCRETHDSYMAISVTEAFATALSLSFTHIDMIEHCTCWLTRSPKELRDCETAIHDAINRAMKSTNGDEFKDRGGYILDTFTIAVWGLLHSHSFKEGMLKVIRLGGDTGTNAACYGQLAGAYYGYQAIPEEWSRGVYLSDELIEISDKLLNIDECPIIRTRFEDDDHFVSYEDNNSLIRAV